MTLSSQDKNGTPDKLTDLVNRFAAALLEKLRAAEQKYGYQNGWAHDDWKAECQRHLNEHLAKGDPRDVAAYCAFLWHHGWPTVGPLTPDDVARVASIGTPDDAREALERARPYIRPPHPGDIQADADLRAVDLALAAIPREQEVKPVDAIKLTYIKRWRTIVKLPAQYADEIRDALAAPPLDSPGSAHQLQGGDARELPQIPDDDADFTPDLARKIIAKYQAIIAMRNSDLAEARRIATPPAPVRAEPEWQCAARKQGTAGGNAPADCDWPGCGCDPAANKVLEAIDEAGFEITKKSAPVRAAAEPGEMREASRAQHFDLPKGKPAQFVCNGILETCQCRDCAALSPASANEGSAG